MRKIIAALFLTFLVVTGPVRAGERLLVPELMGWRVISTHNDQFADVSELIPPSQSEEDWTRRLTVQAFRGGKMDAGEYLDGLIPRTEEVCDSIVAEPIQRTPLAGFEGGRRSIACGRYQGDGKGSYTLFFAIRGHEALYVLARSWRGEAFKPQTGSPVPAQEFADWQALFDGVRICDTADSARPCPR